MDTNHQTNAMQPGVAAVEPESSVDIVSREPIRDVDGASRTRARMAAQLVGTQQMLGSASPSPPPGTIQAKLRIGRPDDVYEREADRVADAVMKMPDSKAQRQMDSATSEEEPMEGAQAKVMDGVVQREEGDEEEEPIEGAQAKVMDGVVQREEGDEEEEPMEGAQAKVMNGTVQREEGDEEEPGGCPGCQRSESNSGSRGSALRGDNIAQGLDLSSSSGRPLDTSQLDYFGSRMNRDFSNVRVHSGPRAESLAQSINAKAFTKGRDIYFGSALYQPNAESGQKLLAHELAHVVQQRAAEPHKG